MGIESQDLRESSFSSDDPDSIERIFIKEGDELERASFKLPDLTDDAEELSQ